MESFGILTLIPPIVIIVFALITKRTWEALLLGSMIGFFYTAKWNVVAETINQLQTTWSNEAWIMMVMFMLGAFAFLLSASKGSYAFGMLIRKFADTEKKNLMGAWVLGILIFMDDYLNMLTVSSATLENSDRNGTPREMLAYVMDSTGAPVCVLIPISSWAVYFAGVMEECMGDNHDYGTGMDMYIQCIPYLFYAWAAIICVPLVILGIIPKVAGMKKAYERVANGGNVWPEDSNDLNMEHAVVEEVKGAMVEGTEITQIELQKDAEDAANLDRFGLRIAAFFVPIIIIVFVTIKTGDMIMGLMWALIAMLFFYVPTKLLSFGRFCEEFANGCAYMVGMNLIMIGALTVKVSMDSIGLPDYVIGVALPVLSPKIFFALAFIIVAALSVVTGSNWGIPAITFPILVPLALQLGVSPVITLACITCAGTFGSHVCFYSDATVLTSQCTKIKNMNHALTQFPYGLMCAGAAFIAYVILGFVTC